MDSPLWTWSAAESEKNYLSCLTQLLLMPEAVTLNKDSLLIPLTCKTTPLSMNPVLTPIGTRKIA